MLFKCHLFFFFLFLGCDWSTGGSPLSNSLAVCMELCFDVRGPNEPNFAFGNLWRIHTLF